MKVNLGCGNKILQGWVNLDKYDVYPVDVVHDLETFPIRSRRAVVQKS
ncbi:MAG: hypothetical protein CM15mP89_2880 [Gammaproteobacteria bacterium]|nr:MAG: hypothetical protein CM15mP89_2880 [Gammaproteobacteria bacterium]